MGFSLALLFAPLVIPAQAPRFESTRLFPEFPQAEFVLTSDFNEDGKPDLASNEGDALLLYLGDGLGNFEGPTEVVAIDFGAVQHVDVTGDGHRDLVLSSKSTDPPNRIVVLPGDGLGQYGVDAGFLLPATAFEFVVADIDGDGAGEIAVRYSASPVFGAEMLVRWWDWDGAAFVGGPALNLGATLFGPPQPSRFVAVDFDGDGTPDLVGFDTDGKVSYLPTVAGASTAAIEIPIETQPDHSGRGVYASDVDLDGDKDLVVIATPTQTVTFEVLRNNGGGTWTSLGVSSLAISQFSYSGAFFGDWDGDGDQDVASSRVVSAFGDPEIWFVENKGAGVFAVGSRVPGGGFGRGAGLADFDLDGLLDFAMPEGLKYGNGVLNEASFDEVQLASYAGSLPRDWEGDGDVDLFFGKSILVNDGAGHFVTNDVFPPDLPGDLTYARTPAIGDFDGDGRMDILIALDEFVPFEVNPFASMHILRDNGFGTFDASSPVTEFGVELAAPTDPSAYWPTEDLDGDGDVDVVVTDGFWPNADSAFLEGFVPLFDGKPLRVEDVDGDGDLDVYTRTGTDIVLQRNDALQFVPEVFLSNVAVGESLELLDVDGDGDTDLVLFQTVGSYSSAVLHENDGVAFGNPQLLLNVFQNELDRAFAGDLTGDGVRDLVLATREDGPMHVFVGSASGFSLASTWVASRPEHAFDADGDGDIDFVGHGVLDAWRFDGEANGVIRQFGAGTPGAGGAVPLLGASGPVRVDSESASLHVRLGLGGTVGLMALSFDEAEIADFPFSGMTTYVGSLLGLVPIALGGAPGVAGEGQLDIPIDVGPGLVGVSFFYQALFFDPSAPTSFTASNALEVLYGSE